MQIPEALILWCASSCLFALGGLIITLSLLHYGAGPRFKNRRYAELVWQAKQRDTDWWLAINREKDKRS